MIGKILRLGLKTVFVNGILKYKRTIFEAYKKKNLSSSFSSTGGSFGSAALRSRDV